MAVQPGVFIVLEGTDGSGKGTQFKLLTERLKAAGYDVAVFDFPRYEQASSHFVKKYLNGEYGPANSISPYAASLFFALDRFETAPQIRQAIDKGRVVLSNRYVGSNMAHQGAKFSRPAERRAFFMWADNLEYQVLAIPRPNLNLCLMVPAETAYQLIGQKAGRSYTKDSHDQHEADINHLRESVATYELLCQLFPKDFEAINCAPNQQLLGIPDINELIWQRIKPLLPPAKKRGRSTTVNLDSATNRSQTKDSTDNHYRISGLALNQLLAANPLLDITIKPDLNQFYLPPGLPKKVAQAYGEAMRSNEQKRAKLRQNLLTQGKQRSKQLDSLNQAIDSAAYLSGFYKTSFEASAVKNWPKLEELAAIIPTRPPKPDKASYSDGRFSHADDDPVKLLSASPRNEFDSLAAGLYEGSELSYDELADELATLKYESKQQKLESALKADPAFRLQTVYRFEVCYDSLSLRHLVQSGATAHGRLQSPSPRLGYAIPQVIEDSGLADDYSELFDDSLELHGILSEKAPELAPYGALQGHRQRFSFETTVERLVRAAKYHKSGEAGQIMRVMIDKIGEFHPITADYLKRQLPRASLSGKP